MKTNRILSHLILGTFLLLAISFWIYPYFSKQHLAPLKQIPILVAKQEATNYAKATSASDSIGGQTEAGGSGNTITTITTRNWLTQFMLAPKPLAPPTVVEAFVKAHNTPGAFVAAAGASREVSWLKRGLQVFPNDPTLLRASVLFDWQYLRDPALLDAWKASDPESGWTHILEADIALGRGDPKGAYQAIKNALSKEISLENIAEIDAFRLETGNTSFIENFRDVGDPVDIIHRLALELLGEGEKAKSGGNSSESSYYAAAALALAELRSGSDQGYSALIAADEASHALNLIGAENAVSFLNGQTYEEAKHYYIEIEKAGRTAMKHRTTLTDEAAGVFDTSVNQYGIVKAVEMVKNPK